MKYVLFQTIAKTLTMNEERIKKLKEKREKLRLTRQLQAERRERDIRRRRELHKKEIILKKRKFTVKTEIDLQDHAIPRSSNRLKNLPIPVYHKPKRKFKSSNRTKEIERIFFKSKSPESSLNLSADSNRDLSENTCSNHESLHEVNFSPARNNNLNELDPLKVIIDSSLNESSSVGEKSDNDISNNSICLTEYVTDSQMLMIPSGNYNNNNFEGFTFSEESKVSSKFSPESSLNPCRMSLSLKKQLLSSKKREQQLRRDLKSQEETLKSEVEFRDKKIEESQKTINSLRASLSREKQKSLLPLEKNVKKIIKKGEDAVKKELLTGQVLKTQILENKLKFETEKEKSVLGQIVSGEVVKAYSCESEISPLASVYLQNKHSTSEKLIFNRSVEKKKSKNEIERNEVIKFFEKDENSTMAPSVKETLTELKVTKRKRYLRNTVDELYLKFSEENKNLNISRTKFYNLKPFWVVNQKLSALDTCLCKNHENFSLILEKLSYLKILNSKSSTDFTKSLTCDYLSKSCMYRECINCNEKSISVPNDSSATFYYQWVTNEIDRTGAKNATYHVRITEKEKKSCTVKQLVEELNSRTPLYLQHVYDTGHQYKAIEKIKENLQFNEASVVIDFSQNYTGKYSKAIQSAHFGASQKQMSLHTGAFFYKKIEDPKKTECVSFCTVSECLRHDAVSIWAHMQPILKLIKSYVSDLKSINFQSDGPSTQYKNKTNFYLFSHYCKVLGLNYATWNFTTAGHGKSCADGTGATVKGLCDRAVSNGVDVISAQNMIDVAKSSNSKVKMFLITENDIQSLDAVVPKELKPAPNSMKIHQLLWIKEKGDVLFLNYLSCFQCIKNPPCTHYSLQPNQLTINPQATQPAISIKENSKRLKSRIKLNRNIDSGLKLNKKLKLQKTKATDKFKNAAIKKSAAHKKKN